MTIHEVIDAIQQETKPYIGVMPVTTFCSTISRIKAGTAKASTIRGFFGSFGYIGEYNSWFKVPQAQRPSGAMKAA